MGDLEVFFWRFHFQVLHGIVYNRFASAVCGFRSSWPEWVLKVRGLRVGIGKLSRRDFLGVDEGRDALLAKGFGTQRILKGRRIIGDANAAVTRKPIMATRVR